MFWDMSNISWASNLIYDSHFTTFIFPNADVDQGAVPIYSGYVAFLWLIFGKSLFVSHLAILPFVIGTLYQFYKLSLRFINKNQLYLALVLLFIDPTIFTQAYLAGMDIVFCFLFLLGVNSAIDNKRILLLLSLVLMPVLRLRGFTFVISIFLIDWFINRENFQSFKIYLKNRFLIYLLPLSVFILWYILHYNYTGWLIVSENRKAFHHLNGLEGMIKNFIFILWKIFDFGRIFLFIPIILFFKFQKPKEKKGQQLIIILFFTVLPYIVFFLPLSYPVSHRHFMITYILGIIAFAYFVGNIKKSYRTLIYSFVIFGLLSGNFWLYPERYGNGWDASMKVYPYFKLKNDFDNYIKNSNIDPNTIGTKFPMDFDLYYSNLEPEKFGYQYIDESPIEKFNYIVQSNISNTFTPEEIVELKNNWVLEKEILSWPIYIRLYRKP
jgi:hypothetical protein